MEEGLAHFFWGGSCNPHKKYELSKFPTNGRIITQKKFCIVRTHLVFKKKLSRTHLNINIDKK